MPINPNMALSKCIGSEHISPEGFKYYCNSVTQKSQPEELPLSERRKQQQMPTFHQHRSQLQQPPPALSALPVPQFIRYIMELQAIKMFRKLDISNHKPQL
ncbi:hypothetical protein K1719_006062 [Acacia pycnantha]|nr:hypothetical protein K1719_006062 [Acacia pycnantha]